MTPRICFAVAFAPLLVAACASGESSPGSTTTDTRSTVTVTPPIESVAGKSTAEVATATANDVVDLVSASPTIDDALNSLSSFPYEQLARASGMDVDELREGLGAIYEKLAPQARGQGIAGFTAERRRFINPLAFMGTYGADQGVDKIRHQTDPKTEESEIAPKSVTQKITTATGSIEMTVDIGGTIIRVEGASWTISSTARVTSSIVSGLPPVTVVEDIQLSIKASSCPDASGRAPFESALAVNSVVTAGEGAGSTSTLTSSVTGFAIANDNADLVKQEETLSVQRALSEPGKPPVSVDFGFTADFGTNVTPAPRNLRMTWDGLNAEAAGSLAAFSTLQSAIAAGSVAGAMETAWKSGLCVEARIEGVTPGSTDIVSKDEEVPIKVSASHRIDGGDLSVPIDAQLEGVFLINPTGKRLPAPATFTYIAGSTNGDKGTVTVQAISKRGKSKPLTELFEVKGQYTVDVTDYSGGYRITGQVCDTSYLFELHWDGGNKTFITGTMEFLYTPSSGISDWTFTGTLKGSPVNATGQWTLDDDAETITLISQNWTVTAPFAGALPLGPGGKHIDLSAPIPLLTDPPPAC